MPRQAWDTRQKTEQKGCVCAGILLNLALSAPTAHAVTTHSGLEAALANAEADEGVGGENGRRVFFFVLQLTLCLFRACLGKSIFPLIETLTKRAVFRVENLTRKSRKLIDEVRFQVKMTGEKEPTKLIFNPLLVFVLLFLGHFRLIQQDRGPQTARGKYIPPFAFEYLPLVNLFAIAQSNLELGLATPDTMCRVDRCCCCCVDT